MNKLIIALCVAVFATTAAAKPWASYHCPGNVDIAQIPEKYFMPRNCETICDGKEHFFDMKKDPHEKHPLPSRLFHIDASGNLLYKGKKCEYYDDSY